MFGRSRLRAPPTARGGGGAAGVVEGASAFGRGMRVRVGGEEEGDGDGDEDVGLERSITIGEARGFLRVRGGGDVGEEESTEVALEVVRALRGETGGDAGNTSGEMPGLMTERGFADVGGTFGRSSCRLAKDCTRLAEVGDGLADELLLLLMPVMLRVRVFLAVSESESGSEAMLARRVPSGRRTGAATAATRAAGFARVSCTVAGGDSRRIARRMGDSAASVGEVCSFCSAAVRAVTVSEGDRLR